MKRKLGLLSAFFPVLLALLVLPAFSNPVCAAGEDDILGRWERYGDGAEGSIVLVEKADGKYRARLEKAAGTLVELGFQKNDIKWQKITCNSAGVYTGEDMFRFIEGGYEYRASTFKINSKGDLEVSVQNKGDAVIGTYQTWRKLSAAKKGQIVLFIGNAYMKVNGMSKEIDPGKGTKPVIVDSRTVLPIRAIVEELGGTIGWDGNEKKVTIQLNSKTLELWIGCNTTKVNGVEKNTDVAPQIINGRTMLPLRYIIDNLGYEVIWEGTAKSVTINY
ncbi:MAG: copper amine oxidase N-terminal domain-containing protein [Clostridia bacterium]|nr:copper amine oxidase N-terminal domain-containing protein [Clostridia bacterium]